MNKNFVRYILFGQGDFKTKQQCAKQLAYTMFEHNSDVYSTSDGVKLFALNALYK
jgi:hypothetical protein